ncbi:hypothetical protein EVAR_74837_1 [Eumeta japonica]|uniref:Uncharacterized protein n=1 Tax=Eumeta variegata TaxID=151549 RepID=A0A4C1SSB5_EUMVA|nr:hypothetical protein EVAR_74837_1 [Eumeta japonica]
MQSGPSIRPPDGIISSYACSGPDDSFNRVTARQIRGDTLRRDHTPPRPAGVDGESWRARPPPGHRHRGTAGCRATGAGLPLRRLTTTRVDIKKKTATGAADGRARRSLD